MTSPPQMRAVDRLSALPDSVLTHLLSFLPTKQCVATSILSTRWRFLWQYVPVIDLSVRNEDAVSRVVSLHKVERLDAFRLFLDFGSNCSIRQIEEWIIAVVERNVRKLDLCFNVIYTVPPPLFTCETLVDLRLVFGGVAPTSLTSVCLPRLKCLKLRFFQFEAGESLTRLISGCPVLEELQIEYIGYEHLVRFVISSPTIKRLKLILMFTFELNTPALEDLHLDDHVCEQIDSGPLPSLIKARVAFSYDDEHVEDKFQCYSAALNFVNKLSEVQSLDVYLECYIQNMELLLGAWSAVSFNNLTRLTLEAPNRLLHKFLECANNLEYLCVSEVDDDDFTAEAWIDPQRVPTCLLSSLGTIILGNFYAVPNKLEMIRYLLKNGLVLETMEMHIWPPSSVYEISQFERGSETCELRFS